MKTQVIGPLTPDNAMSVVRIWDDISMVVADIAQLDPDDTDETPDDDAPEQDPDPAPPREGDVSEFEEDA